MAVTESKGNGYALYNGVKLPNIDTVWTEELKQTHPYAVMASVDYGEVTEEYAGVHMYSLNLFPIPPAYFGKDTNGSGTFTKCLFWDEVAEIPSYALVDSDKIGEQLGVQACVWFYTNRLVDDKIITGGFAGELFWTNYTILGADRVDGAITPDGTTHMEASDPIPLDGMNVIEWDGVTEGLESDVSGTHLRIADYQDAENALLTCRAGTLYVAMLDAFETVEKTETEPSGWVLYQDDTVLLAFGEEYATMRPGIWILADYFVGVESFILAYTPATTEPEEPEEPETPTVEKFPLMELIMGILSELNAGVNREPIAYLYNGVRLPKLPEWDRGVYPFAVIFASGAFWIMTELPYISSEGNTYALSAQYKIYTVQNGEYVLKSSSSGVQVGSAPIWSNSDLYNSNGTLYLEASDPVPVYE